MARQWWSLRGCCQALAGVLLLSTSLGRHGVLAKGGKSCDKKTIRFRTLDGRFNNLAHPDWGRANSKLLRLLPNAYSDGVSSPRVVNVSAREVSVAFHGPSTAKASVSMMVMQWGQFLDHDLTFVHQHTVHETEECCSNYESSECFSIRFEHDEYFKNRTCLPLIRSKRETAENGVEEQVNAITSYIDASNVYGSSDEDLQKMRGKGAFLQMAKGGMLPKDDDPIECDPQGPHYCFLAGDKRVNEHPGLATMHTIFMRQHNRIVKSLRRLDNNWDHTRLFEEARRILVATVQVITYEEFLPKVLSVKTRLKYKLVPGKNYKYNKSTNPTIFNSFAAAAYRFGHSLIPEALSLSRFAGDLNLEDCFFKTASVFSSMLEIVEGLYQHKCMKADNSFSLSITRHLFQHGEQTGLDLVALNIQRGRDHGLPSYNEYRTLCNLPRKVSLEEIFPNSSKTANVYANVDEVDLYPGAMSEPSLGSGLVGETFACLLGRQFKSLKQGDRFFYESQGEAWSFTKAQLKEIRKMRLSKVICQNTPGLKVIPRDVFKPGKKRVKCSAIPDIDYSKWKEHDNTGREFKDRKISFHLRSSGSTETTRRTLLPELKGRSSLISIFIEIPVTKVQASDTDN